MTEAILAVDVGSSSTRAMLCDRTGADIGGTFTQRASRFERTTDGGATLDADEICSAVFACIDEVLTKAAGVTVTQVAVDTFVTSLLGVDAHGTPTTPLYTWSDGRGGELLPVLAARLDASAYSQRTGAYLHPSYWPLRLAWLREADPQAFAATRTWLSFGAYLTLRVTGAPVMSVSDAAWTGLLDRHELAWDTVTLDAIGVPESALPRIGEAALSGHLRDEFARRWPALRDAIWHPAIGDGVASNIGAACTLPHQVALSIGTSGALRVLLPGTPDRVPDGLFCYRVDTARSLVGGAVSNAGSIYEWLHRTLQVEREATEALLATMPPDAHGLTVLPYLAPERSPFWDSGIPSAIIGVTGATTPQDILRASMEAVACGFARIAHRLTPLLPDGVVVVAGGAAVERSPALMQMLADALGQPVAAASGEATICGVVRFHTGASPASAAFPRVYTPDPARTALYSAIMARQDRLIATLRG